MHQLLSSLSSNDTEHPDVALSHESEWCISVFSSGRVVFENLETGEGPWHLTNKSPADALQLWKLLATGQIAELKKQSWLPGYGV